MKTNTQKGITLIALIITIIVMLILVGVSVSVALNTGLFKAAQGAAKNTEAQRLNETALSNGMITLNDGRTDSVQNIVNSYKGGTTGGGEDGEGAQWEITTDSGETGLSVGDLVTYKEKDTEKFYVISVTGDTVAMLAAKNITTTGTLEQSDSAPLVKFCSSTAWNGASVTGGDNLNEKQSIKSEATSVVALAKSYGESLGVETGRLMLKSEADALYTSNPSILNGHSTGWRSYWLGTAGSPIVAHCVGGSGIEVVTDLAIDHADYGEAGRYGVRPVIVISEFGV